MEKILNTLIDQYKEEMRETLAELVRIPSVIDMESATENAPFGHSLRNALDKILEIGKNMGFTVKDYDGYIATIQWGNEGKEVAALSHIDVVPAGEGWNTNPFDPVIIDGKMFGRGTLDDKGPMVAVLYAMKAVMESKLPVQNHIKHIVGCDEENGHRCIKYYLGKEKAPDMGFSPDALFSVIHGEKAIIWLKIKKELKNTDKKKLYIKKISGGTAVNAVPNVSKVWLTDEDGNEKCIEYSGVSSHAMQPWAGENAIVKMIDDLRKQEFLDMDARQYFETLYELFGPGYYGNGLGIACEDQLSGKLTMNLGTIKMEENTCELMVDIRCPIHINPETIMKTVQLVCEKHGLTAEHYMTDPALYVPKDSELVQKLLKVYNDVTGRNEEPLTIGGGTYCRNADNLVSFGPLFPGEPDLAHEANEYIDLENMLLSAKIYAQAIYELMK